MVKLVVGNLPPSATNQSLKELFHEYEDLKDYKLISNYGFVYLESEESARHAVYNLNGIEYRGFPVTIDYVGDSRNKRKLPTPAEENQFQKVPNPIQKKPMQPQMEQRNPNPYNLSYPNGNNGITRSFDIAPDNNYRPPQKLMEARNPNPYNLPFSNAGIGAPKSFNPMPDKRYGLQQFQDYNPRMYRPSSYSNDYNMPQPDQYVAASSYNDYDDCTQQYIPEEEYFSNVHPAKRLRTNQYTDNSGYVYNPRQSKDFVETNYRQSRPPQPSYDTRQIPMRPSYMHPRDEINYRPRGRAMYKPNRSYIDEYEDDQDYGEVDPYPSYLKQYKK